MPCCVTYEANSWVGRPWYRDRPLFGINEFAGDFSHLAVQKPRSDVQLKILHHHASHLQCIVDSLAVFRGWSVATFVGHVLNPPAVNFWPRRDVDHFMIVTMKDLPRVSATQWKF